MNFARLASTVIHRSVFRDRPSRHLTFNAGDLVPLGKPFLMYPGDTFKIKPVYFLRFSSPFVAPVMDNCYLDSFWFFVPFRLVWSHFQNFMGESDTPYDPETSSSTDYLVPTITAPDGGFGKGSLADYFQVEPYKKGVTITSLYHRAYNLIYNEWFRRQSLQSALPVASGESDDLNNYKVRKRVKARDYFTSGLPWPQRGPDVGLNLSGDIPVQVYGNGKGLMLTNGIDYGYLAESGAFASGRPGVIGTSVGFGYIGPFNQDLGNTLTGTLQGNQNKLLGVHTNPAECGLTGRALLSDATMITVSELRNAFQVQKLYEKDARGGTRYTEIIRTHFGTVSSDARLQRPEFIGSTHQRISVNTVVQNSSSTNDAPLGTLAAFGVGSDVSRGFTYSATEHGIIMGLVNVRTDLSYQQGIPREMMYQTRLDFYWPVFAHLSEQSTYRGEIFATGTAADRETFNYNERYSEMRYEPSGIMGEFRSTYSASLDVWHFAEQFADNPTFSEAFILDPSQSVLDRCLQVSSSVSDQILLDVSLDMTRVRPLPTFGTPGLVDHF